MEPFQDVFRQMTVSRIDNYQIHLHRSPGNTFINTVILESFKLAPLVFRPSIITHPHPQSAVHSFPFCIINGSLVHTHEHILRHIISVVDEKSIERAEGEDTRITSNLLAGYELRALITICE